MVVVLSHSMWRKDFAGDLAIVAAARASIRRC